MNEEQQKKAIELLNSIAQHSEDIWESPDIFEDGYKKVESGTVVRCSLLIQEITGKTLEEIQS